MARLKVNEENLLELLTTKLYSTDPNLAIRELLQNASDAINEASSDRKHVIDVEFDGLSTDRLITVTDTGIGMNAEELESRLAVVADGDKVRRAQTNDNIAGRFGIGFLSTLIIADEVEVLTRKAGESQSWRFLLKKSGEYFIEESFEHDTQGTKVILKVGEANQRSRELVDKISDLLTEEGMNYAVREWGYLLKFPVRIKSRTGVKQVNAQVMPWENDTAAAAAFEDVFGNENKPVFTHRFENLKNSGVELSGVIYFNQGMIYKPTARLYSRGLLVDAENSSLMPDYAPFAYCIVESSQVEVDLARRNAEQDATFRALSNAIWREFSKAFSEFGSKYKNEMVTLWAAVDNSTTAALLRLLDTSTEKLKDKRNAATDFIIQAAPHIPFHTLDEISGAQGRPRWMTISEMMVAQQNRLDSHHTPGELMDIYYTDSRVPVEKDILITQHSALIDVGREEKSHDALLRFYQRHIDEISTRHGFRLVPAVMPQPEEVSADDIRNLWQPTLDLIHQGVHFYQRDHEVVVEKIVPEDTPVIVGMEDIDDETVEGLREHLKEIGMSGPTAANLFQKLDQVLSGASSSKIRVRVNADNTTMRNLAKAALKEATVRDAEVALRTIVWRAVLDYFGFSATRQMISEERMNVNRIVATLLNRAERLSDAQDQQSATAAELATLKKETNSITRSPEQPRNRFVGVVDIQESTRKIFGVTDADTDIKARVLESLINGISKHLENYVEISGFTGDGIQFLLRDDLQREDYIRAGNVLRELSNQVRTIIAEQTELSNFFTNHGFGAPQLRVAMDYGEVFESRIATRIEAYGQPFIKATRIVSDKGIYREKNISLLLSPRALNKGAESVLWDASGFKEIGSVNIRGLQPEEMPVFAPSTT